MPDPYPDNHVSDELREFRASWKSEMAAISRGRASVKLALKSLADQVANNYYILKEVKTIVTDKTTVEMTEGHTDLLPYIPFNCDESVETVLSTPSLSNALFSKVRHA